MDILFITDLKPKELGLNRCGPYLNGILMNCFDQPQILIMFLFGPVFSTIEVVLIVLSSQ